MNPEKLFRNHINLNNNKMNLIFFQLDIFKNLIAKVNYYKFYYLG